MYPDRMLLEVVVVLLTAWHRGLGKLVFKELGSDYPQIENGSGACSFSRLAHSLEQTDPEPEPYCTSGNMSSTT